MIPASSPTILIVGAGAIGRGYIPWVFANEKQKHQFQFVDVNESLIDLMKLRKSFTTHRVNDSKYETLEVSCDQAFTPWQYIQEANKNNLAAVFVSVGPRNIAKLQSLLKDVQAPIILCENDPLTVNSLQSLLPDKTILFAVPDVITSNSAAPEILAGDPLAICTEKGELFIDSKLDGLHGDFQLISGHELIQKQWTAKLFLHNTPHCIAAYLGALSGAKYLHEAMSIPEIDQIVQGSMLEMLNSLKARWDLSHDFLEWYAEKELKRFRNSLLFDPIVRVSREPLRKLEPEGRLLGAAQICLSLGFVPENIMTGIAAALLFDNDGDNDRHLSFMQKSMSSAMFLSHVLGLRHGEAFGSALQERLPQLFERLKALPKLRNKNEVVSEMSK